MLSRKVCCQLVFAAALLVGFPRLAHSAPAYEVGLPTQFEIVPGQIVSIPAEIINTGDMPIVFAPTPVAAGNGLPSVQGGAIPGVSFGYSPTTDWLGYHFGITLGPYVNGSYNGSDFFPQFDGVVIEPGNAYSMVLATFEVPTDEPLGTSAELLDVSLDIYFTDAIWGFGRNITQLFTNPPIFSYYVFEGDGPNIDFTVGNSPSVGPDVFTEATVLNVKNGIIISGPASLFQIPEPSAFFLFGGIFTIMVLILRQSPSGKPKLPIKNKSC